MSTYRNWADLTDPALNPQFGGRLWDHPAPGERRVWHERAEDVAARKRRFDRMVRKEKELADERN